VASNEWIILCENEKDMEERDRDSCIDLKESEDNHENP
jgi:hypothetical protein